jgi:hypothetical protein
VKVERTFFYERASECIVSGCRQGEDVFCYG